MTTAINVLPDLHISSTTNCCPLINPADWDGRTFVFDGKLFAKARTHSFLHIPLNMNTVMKHTQAKIDAVNARSDDFLILSDEVSPWHADHYFAVTHDVPGLEMEKLSGRYMTKVFEGEYREAGTWYHQLIEYVQSRNKVPVKTYFFYTVCPKCSKAYGKNYVIGFEQITEE